MDDYGPNSNWLINLNLEAALGHAARSLADEAKTSAQRERDDLAAKAHVRERMTYAARRPRGRRRRR